MIFIKASVMIIPLNFYVRPMLIIGSLHSKILNMYNVHCPIQIKYVSPIDRIKLWINTEIMNNIKTKTRYFQLFKQNLLPKILYHNFRSLITSKIKRAKTQYYRTVCESVSIRNTKKNLLLKLIIIL